MARDETGLGPQFWRWQARSRDHRTQGDHDEGFDTGGSGYLGQATIQIHPTSYGDKHARTATQVLRLGLRRGRGISGRDRGIRESLDAVAWSNRLGTGAV